jgi:hypothetical protein
MPRFVLLYHDCPPGYERPSHWDFMLETGDVLRTWALEHLPRDWQMAHLRTVAGYTNCPANATTNDVAAAQLGDHRRDYLELEGPLSGGRGTIVRVAVGTYESGEGTVADLRLRLCGEVISGSIRLLQQSNDGRPWILIAHEGSKPAAQARG